MADFTKPALTSTYTNFITELKGRDDDISSSLPFNSVIKFVYVLVKAGFVKSAI